METLKTVSLVDTIVQRIITEIRKGTWTAGSQLPPERELMQILGVSRNALREALKQLQFMGLLSIRQGEGTFVNSVDHKTYLSKLKTFIELKDADIADLVEARLPVENKIAKLAALRATPNEIVEIEKLVDESRKVLDLPEVFTRLDTQFHLKVAASSHNPVLLSFLESIRYLLSEQQKKIAYMPGLTEASLTYHSRILAAIKARDGLLAANVMEEHVGNVLYRIGETHKEEQQ